MPSHLALISKLRFIPDQLLRLLPSVYDFNCPLSNKLSWRLFYEKALRTGGNELLGIIPKHQSSVIYLRGDSTDITNFVSIYLHGEYDFMGHDYETIFDLGGYIGLSSSYFAHRCPHAKILVLEPDPQNYALCVLNNSNNKNVKVLNCAVWGDSAQLVEGSRNAGAMSITFQAERAWAPGLAKTRGVTVEELMTEFDIDFIGFLKIDIEGAERFVFSSQTIGEWLPRVGAMSIELHESKYPGCDTAVYSAAESEGFTSVIAGEYTYFYK